MIAYLALLMIAFFLCMLIFVVEGYLLTAGLCLLMVISCVITLRFITEDD